MLLKPYIMTKNSMCEKLFYYSYYLIDNYIFVIISCHLLLIKIEGFDFGNILRDENWYKNILVYNISCKTLIGAKVLRIRLKKVNGFIRVYDGTEYLVYLTLKVSYHLQ